MKSTLIQSLFLIMILGRTFAFTNNICDCTKLEKNDCFRRTDCQWNFYSSTPSCQVANKIQTPPTQIEFYSFCSEYSNYQDCHNYLGCAFFNSKCIPFSSCLSMNGGTEEQCNRYSRKCHYSPSQQLCVEFQTCTDYGGTSNMQQCETMAAIYGSYLCKYDHSTNTCRNKVCEDVQVDFSTSCEAEIENYNCNSNFVTCTNYFSSDCSSYSKQPDICNDILTQIGGCEFFENKCVERICAHAPDEYISAENCKYYHRTCIFNGVGCSEQFVSCSTYSATDCNKYIGINGKCVLTNQTTCQDPTCENFIYTTNEACQQIAPELHCISNGIKCVSQLSAQCDTLLAANADCTAAFSKEGRCKLSSNGIYCENDLCSNYQFTTNDACNKYSKYTYYGQQRNGTCFSNGKICVQKKNCNQYSTDEINGDCSKISGFDGQCQNDTTTGSQTCIIQKCEDIKSPTSQDDCTKGNFACRFDGFSCLPYLKNCSAYSKNCDKVISLSNKKCFQTSLSPVCVEKTCETAPHYFERDVQCFNYSSGCITNNAGCVSQQNPCSFYQGTDQICKKYKGSDGVCKGSNEPGPCIKGDCSSQVAVDDSQCQTYSPFCLFDKRTGRCAQYVEFCQNINDSNKCLQVITIQQGRICSWNMNDHECQPSRKEPGLCNQLTQQYQCIRDQNDNNCIWDKTNKRCQLFNRCQDYQFEVYKDNENNILQKSKDVLTAETQICQSISIQCYSNGITCFPQMPCQIFTTKEMCKNSNGIGGVMCGYNVNLKKCQNFVACSDVQGTTHEECQDYSTSCTTYNQSCINWTQCSKRNEEMLCIITKSLEGQCFWNGTNCNILKCSDLIKITHLECYETSNECTSDGSKCIDLAPCSSYVNKESCQLGLEASKTIDCFYDANSSTCRNKKCEDNQNVDQTFCQNLKCAFNSETKSCITFNSCNQYTTEAQCNNNNLNGLPCIWSSQLLTCKQFTNCSDAETNEKICNSNNICYFGENNATNSSSCQLKDCYHNNLNATITSGCEPIIFINGTVVPCIWNDNESKCKENSSLDKNNCMFSTDFLSFWIEKNQLCQSCSNPIINNGLPTQGGDGQGSGQINNGTSKNETSNNQTRNNDTNYANSTFSKFEGFLHNIMLYLIIFMVE